MDSLVAPSGHKRMQAHPVQHLAFCWDQLGSLLLLKLTPDQHAQHVAQDFRDTRYFVRHARRGLLGTAINAPISLPKQNDDPNNAQQGAQPERGFGRIFKSKVLGRRRVSLVVGRNKIVALSVTSFAVLPEVPPEVSDSSRLENTNADGCANSERTL